MGCHTPILALIELKIKNFLAIYKVKPFVIRKEAV